MGNLCCTQADKTSLDASGNVNLQRKKTQKQKVAAKKVKNTVGEWDKVFEDEQKLQSIVEECAGGQWTDPDFPPEKQSLMVDWDLGHEDVVKNAPRWEGFEWLRPNEISELSGEGLKLFDKIEPNDILQGGLGDCYFMCCLSTIAEWPERIQRMFTNKTISPNGVYGVRLYRNGEPLTVFVDDNIVCDSGRVAFASAKGQELWTILIEKAFAKSFGSFLRIIGGWPADTLRDLTGAPTEVYDNKEHDADKMFEIIYDGEVKDYMMCASKNQSDGPKAAGGESLDEQFGLAGGHAYSMLSAQKVVGSDGAPARIVCIRNPWGNDFEWTGAWSDESSIWTDKARVQCDMVERGADGKFWMTIEDFKLHFSNFSVCMTVDDYKYSYVSLTQEGNGLNDMNCLSFEIKKKGEYTFSAIQRDDREFPIDSDYGYSPTKMCLAKGNSLDELMIKKGKFFLWKRDSNLCFDNLEPGKYFLFVQQQWDEEKNPDHRDFVVSSYGCASIDLYKFGLESTADFMRPLFMNAWKKNLLEFTQNEVMGGITFHEHTDHKAFGFTAKICVNTSGQDLIEKVEFSSRDGYYTLEPHTIEDESYEFVAKSGDEPAILIGAPNLNYGCSTSSSMQFSFSG